MPTTSVRSGFTFTNVGPLTTTATVPTACLTQTTRGVYLFENNDVRYDLRCETGTDVAWCLPTAPTPTVAVSDILGRSYYSPGLYCPAGWETVGVATADKHGTATSTSGVFTLGPETEDSIIDYAPNELRQILAPHETAVLCCPSGLNPQREGFCFSTVSNYPISTGCLYLRTPESITMVNVTYTFPETVVTGRIPSVVGTWSPPHLTVVSLTPSETEVLHVRKEVAMVLLVHRPEDLPGGTGTTDTGTGTGTGVRVGGVVVLALLLGVFLL